MPPKKTPKNSASVLADLLEEDSPDNAVTLPSDGDMSSLQKLYAEYSALSTEIDEAEEALKEKKEALKMLTEQRIPEVMFAAKLRAFTAEDGTQVTIQDQCAVSIKEADRKKAMDWLRKNGHGDIIKQEISVDFPRGLEDKAQKLRSLLAKNGFSYEEKEGIHAGTLKAFVRTLIEDGKKFPRNLFGVYEFRVAKFKKGKG